MKSDVKLNEAEALPVAVTPTADTVASSEVSSTTAAVAEPMSSTVESDPAPHHDDLAEEAESPEMDKSEEDE